MITYQLQYMDDGWNVLYSEDVLRANLFLEASAWRWVDSTGNRETVGYKKFEALVS